MHWIKYNYRAFYGCSEFRGENKQCDMSILFCEHIYLNKWKKEKDEPNLVHSYFEFEFSFIFLLWGDMLILECHDTKRRARCKFHIKNVLFLKVS